MVYKLETDSHAMKQLVTLRDPILKAELYFLFFDFHSEWQEPASENEKNRPQSGLVYIL